MRGYVLAGLLAWSASASAGEAPQKGFWVNGAGVVSCGKILEHLKEPGGELQVQQWIWGYISAFNEFHKNIQKGFPDDAAITAYVRNYCAQQPLKTLYNATVKLVSELEPAAPTE